MGVDSPVLEALKLTAPLSLKPALKAAVIMRWAWPVDAVKM